jgi:hypothetical protein
MYFPIDYYRFRNYWNIGVVFVSDNIVSILFSKKYENESDLASYRSFSIVFILLSGLHLHCSTRLSALKAQRSDSKTKRGSIPEDDSYSRRHCCRSYTASCSGRPFRPALRLLPARRHRHCRHWLASPAAAVPARHPVVVRQCLAAVSFNSHDLSHRRKLLQDTRYISAQVSDQAWKGVVISIR